MKAAPVDFTDAALHTLSTEPHPASLKINCSNVRYSPKAVILTDAAKVCFQGQSRRGDYAEMSANDPKRTCQPRWRIAADDVPLTIYLPVINLRKMPRRIKWTTAAGGLRNYSTDAFFAHA